MSSEMLLSRSPDAGRARAFAHALTYRVIVITLVIESGAFGGGGTACCELRSLARCQQEREWPGREGEPTRVCLDTGFRIQVLFEFGGQLSELTRMYMIHVSPLKACFGVHH